MRCAPISRSGARASLRPSLSASVEDGKTSSAPLPLSVTATLLGVGRKSAADTQQVDLLAPSGLVSSLHASLARLDRSAIPPSCVSSSARRRITRFEDDLSRVYAEFAQQPPCSIFARARDIALVAQTGFLNQSPRRIKIVTLLPDEVFQFLLRHRSSPFWNALATYAVQRLSSAALTWRATRPHR
jgi:hypothetical protein